LTLRVTPLVIVVKMATGVYGESSEDRTGLASAKRHSNAPATSRVSNIRPAVSATSFGGPAIGSIVPILRKLRYNISSARVTLTSYLPVVRKEIIASSTRSRPRENLRIAKRDVVAALREILHLDDIRTIRIERLAVDVLRRGIGRDEGKLLSLLETTSKTLIAVNDESDVSVTNTDNSGTIDIGSKHKVSITSRLNATENASISSAGNETKHGICALLEVNAHFIALSSLLSEDTARVNDGTKRRRELIPA